MPETKQRTLEELDYVFAVPTTVHMNFQLRRQLPWAFERYIMRRKGLKQPLLYRFEGVEDDQQQQVQEVQNSNDAVHREVAEAGKEGDRA